MDLQPHQRQRLVDWLRRKQGWFDKDLPLFAEIIKAATAALGFTVDRWELQFAAKLGGVTLPNSNERGTNGRGTLTERVARLEAEVAALKRELKKARA